MSEPQSYPYATYLSAPSFSWSRRRRSFPPETREHALDDDAAVKLDR